MAAALSMLGHLDTKFGKVHMYDATTVFQRWIVAGLDKDPDSDINIVEPERLIWTDRPGFHAMRRQVLARIKIMHDQSYIVNFENADPFDYSIPLINESTNLDEYYDRILDDQLFTKELIDLTSLLQITYQDWTSNPIPIRNDVNLTDALQRVNLQLAPAQLSVTNLRLEFEECMSTYLVRDKGHIESIFNVSPAPNGDTGFGAQLVKSEDVTANVKYKLPDSDLSLGFAFNPLLEFALEPKVVAYSQRSRSQASHAFARKDLKPFAN
jgi:hypothetical protein